MSNSNEETIVTAAILSQNNPAASLKMLQELGKALGPDSALGSALTDSDGPLLKSAELIDRMSNARAMLREKRKADKAAKA